MVLKVSLNTGINRIRLEFKDLSHVAPSLQSRVLIESDWNLKQTRLDIVYNKVSVLIESDWNLKDAS